MTDFKMTNQMLCEMTNHVLCKMTDPTLKMTNLLTTLKLTSLQHLTFCLLNNETLILKEASMGLARLGWCTSHCEHSE